MKWVHVGFGVVVALVCVLVTAFSIAGVVWSRRSLRLRQELMAGALAPGSVAPGVLESVPPVVARFFARSIPSVTEVVIAARFQQEGEFQMGEGPEGWRPFTADQTVTVHPPAFMWDARIKMAPLVEARVRDAYHDGHGGMTAKVGGLVTVMDADPTPELAKAALERYLAESPWTPTRLLPGNGITWEPVDGTTARVTLVDAGNTASVVVTFDQEGDIVTTYVPDRGREVDGAYVPTPWVGRFWDHAVVGGGFRIPRQGEVAWVVDGDTIPYWRGKLTSVEYSGQS